MIPHEWRLPAPSNLLCSLAGLSGGLGRSSVSSGTNEIKREEKEDEENTSVADNSEEEKKELKPSRNRTRCSLNRSLPSLCKALEAFGLGCSHSDPRATELSLVTLGPVLVVQTLCPCPASEEHSLGPVALEPANTGRAPGHLPCCPYGCGFSSCS